MTESDTAKVIYDALQDLRSHETEAAAAFIASRVMNASKQTAFALGLEHGPVLVHLDPRVADVDVPPAFRADPGLTLRIGTSLQPRIPYLAQDRDKIEVTLTFAGQPYTCAIPWRAVYAIKVENGPFVGVWQDSIPPEIQKEVEAAEEKPAPARPRLSLVPMDPAGDA